MVDFPGGMCRFVAAVMRLGSMLLVIMRGRGVVCLWLVRRRSGLRLGLVSVGRDVILVVLVVSSVV